MVKCPSINIDGAFTAFTQN